MSNDMTTIYVEQGTIHLSVNVSMETARRFGDMKASDPERWRGRELDLLLTLTEF